jgi:hypothetical protein
MTNLGDSKRLRLLSLDGGGVRGLSSLLILKKLMESVAVDPDNPPKVSANLGHPQHAANHPLHGSLATTSI